MKIKLILLFAVIVGSVVVRFYNFENRMTFWSEQARSLMVSGEYIKQKPSLLGQEYFKVTSSGHKLFSGALFSYSLVPLQLLFNFDPLPITYYFAGLNIATGIILFLVTKKLFDYQTALFSMILFLFNSYMIAHSMYIWILNYYPLIGLLVLYLFYLFNKEPTKRNSFLLGILCGIATNFHYLFIPFLIGIFVFIVRKIKVLAILFLFLLGSAIGNFPMILFDVRHDFYHLRTLFEFSLDIFKGGGDGNLTYYHFLHIWPLFSIFFATLLVKLWKKNKSATIVIIFLYLVINITSERINFNKPVGMPEGIIYKDVITASKLISGNADSEFNVASALDFDKRGYIMRYPTEYIFSKKPLGVEDYDVSFQLYVLAKDNYNLSDSDIWEIKVMSPFKVEKLGNVGEGYKIFKVIRI